MQKGKSSHISLESEIYTQANTVYENGSARDSYAAFTDDEPTAGAAEAKEKLEQQIKHAEFKEQQLMEAMHGSEATTKDASLSSDDDNSSDDDLPEFNQYIQYENGAKVKYQSYDGSFVSGTAYNGTDLNSNPISVFVPDDRDSYNEHNSEVKTVASRGLSALNWIKENVAGIAKLSTYTDTDYSDGTAAIATDVWGDDAAEYFNSSKELREEGEEECREYIDGVSSNVNDYLREKAPYKYQYDEFGKVLTIAQIILTVMDAGVGVVKLIEDSPKFIEDGAKVVNDLSKGDKASEVLEDEIKIAKGEDDYSVTDDADYQKTGDTDTSTPESKDVDTSGTEAQNESVSSTKTEDTNVSNTETEGTDTSVAKTQDTHISNAETGPEPNETSYVKSIDFSKLGTGNVGDFSNLKGTTIDDILSRIPNNAIKRELTPIQGKVQEGFEYKFVENGETIRVRVHGPDQSAPIGSNAYDNWVVRVQKGKKYMDSSGTFHPPGISNPNSEFYDEILIDDTHIPITAPK